MAETIPISGGCHCGAVRFTGRVARASVVEECNCSICAKSGYLHLYVAHDDFVLEQGVDALRSYRFGTGAAEHLFCGTCGIKSFYQPRSHPHAWSVNYRALDPGHGLRPVFQPFDGADWEQAQARR